MASSRHLMRDGDAESSSYPTSDTSHSSTQGTTINMLDLFKAYKESCQIRLAACGDDPFLRVRALDPMIQELLDQNEILINSLSDLQAKYNDLKIRANPPSGQHLTAAAMADPPAGQVNPIEIVGELNSQLTSLQIENNFLRDKNENLEHDVENLLDMLDYERGKASKQEPASGQEDKVRTFCDSFKPEDVFGPIESIKESITSMAEVPESLASSKDSGSGSSEGTTDRGKVDELSKNSTIPKKSVVQVSFLKKGSSSWSSLASSNVQLILEEKELLIEDLQQHLESVTKQLMMSTDVIKKVEEKLNEKRKESATWRSKAYDLQRRFRDLMEENMQLKEREVILIDQKRNLLIRLDEESDEWIRAREQVDSLQQQVKDSQQQIDFQSMTISHLKEALVAKTKALTLLPSSSSSRSLFHRTMDI